MNRYRSYTVLFVLLLLARSILVWYGYDRLPLLSNTEEVICNDPAFWMSKGYGLASRGMEGTLSMEKVFALYPPIYILSQALIFGLFGVSTLTLRGTNIIFFILYTILLMILIYRLRKVEILDDFSAFWAGLLCLADPTAFSSCRMGRPESLAIFFALCAFLVLLSKKGITDSKRRWAASSGLIGLSISTHFEMGTALVMYLVLAGFRFYKKEKWFTLMVFSVPLMVLASIWIGSYGYRSLDALIQFRQLLHNFHPSNPNYMREFGIIPYIKTVFSGSLEKINQIGGLALIVVYFSWIITLAMALQHIRLRFSKGVAWNKWLLAAGLFAVTNFLIINLFTNLSTQRIITVLPAALVGLGVAISRLKECQGFKQLLTGIFAVLVSIGLAGHGLYLYKVHHQWQDRDPLRFSNFVNSIPINKKTAAAFPLWFELVKAGHCPRIIGVGNPYWHRFFVKDSKNLDKFDLIIQYSEKTSRVPKPLTNRTREVVTIGGKDFTVFRKKGSMP